MIPPENPDNPEQDGAIDQDLGEETSGLPLWAGFSQSVSVDRVSPKGLNLQADITSENLDNLRRIFDLQEQPEFSAHFVIKPLSRGRFSVKGEMFARIVQSCIVTLTPVPAVLKENFEVQFWPEEDMRVSEAAEDEQKNKEIHIDPFNENEPEWIENGKLHLGRFLFELFSTSIDPYPRKPGASFEWEKGTDHEQGAKIHPFAVLEALQKKKQNDEK